MKKRIIATLFLLPCISFASYMQLRWTVETSRVQPFIADIWQGETVELSAQLLQYGKPVALPDATTAAMYWQTNGMAGWWTSPANVTTAGLISAIWKPDMDVGADYYLFFIGIRDADTNTIYRTHGNVRMRASPGASPNALPLPIRHIDFATVEVKNAPWLSEEEDPIAAQWQSTHLATSNPHSITAELIGAITAESDPVATQALNQHKNAENPHNISLMKLSVEDDRAASLRVLEPRSIPVADWEWHLSTWDGAVDLIPWENFEVEKVWISEFFVNALLWKGSDLDGAASGYYGWALPEGFADDTWRLAYMGSFISSPLVVVECGNGILPVSPDPEIGLVWQPASKVYSPVTTVEQVKGMIGKFADVATNVSYSVVVSNGHWLIIKE